MSTDTDQRLGIGLINSIPTGRHDDTPDDGLAHPRFGNGAVPITSKGNDGQVLGTTDGRPIRKIEDTKDGD